ncbi:hypothetical protein PSN45_004458 [Yamadazyma tenuis]|uniref:uncharacterized protein n=1 Tax=Candida tenuis TaxID=2315449 RepID=UPI0027AB2601|nr:hypothetical protein PSN45_004458 [Yamadazyma tenuis]
MMKFSCITTFVFLLGCVTSSKNLEFGTYVNPNPRPYERCSSPDLIKLSSCCNVVLTKLDDCKANDLACECCALQSIQQECFNICPGNPSTNFLTVLYQDCAPLNDINACSLPFKKSNELPQKTQRLKEKFENDKEGGIYEKDVKGQPAIFKSKVSGKASTRQEEGEFFIGGDTERQPKNIEDGLGTKNETYFDKDAVIAESNITKSSSSAVSNLLDVSLVTSICLGLSLLLCTYLI